MTVISSSLVDPPRTAGSVSILPPSRVGRDLARLVRVSPELASYAGCAEFVVQSRFSSNNMSDCWTVPQHEPRNDANETNSPNWHYDSELVQREPVAVQHPICDGNKGNSMESEGAE